MYSSTGVVTPLAVVALGAMDVVVVVGGGDCGCVFFILIKKN